MDAPTYAGCGLNQFVIVKAVSGLPVKEEGATDDSAFLNAILAQAAANWKIALVFNSSRFISYAYT